jgi:ribulose-phosphate 3-epimerase
MAVLFASILDADWNDLASEITAAERAGVDGFSVDVMDGKFVPRVTFGAQTVRDVKKNSSLPVEAHLMVSCPKALLEEFCAAGADQITVHLEALDDPLKAIRQIHALGALAGLAVLQETKLDDIPDIVFAELDALNLMAVPVGYGGGVPSGELMERIKAARKRAAALNPGLVIEIDGGMKPQNCGKFVKAGADLIVMGTGIYKAPDYAAAVSEARQNLCRDDAVSGKRTQKLRKKAKNRQ